MANDEYAAFTKLLTDLRQATDDVKEAARATRDAQSREITAINHLNEIQKKFDAVISGMRKEAPRDSDWCRQMCKPQSVS